MVIYDIDSYVRACNTQYPNLSYKFFAMDHTLPMQALSLNESLKTLWDERPVSILSNGGKPFENRKIIVLDINDTLLKRYIRMRVPASFYSPYISIEAEHLILYKRPYLEEFLDYCFKNYRVAIWTTMNKRNAELCLKYILTPQQRQSLLFLRTESDKKDKRILNLNNGIMFIDNTLSKVNMNEENEYYIISPFDASTQGDNALSILMKILPVIF